LEEKKKKKRSRYGRWGVWFKEARSGCVAAEGWIINCLGELSFSIPLWAVPGFGV
jgi:hypothetical protein